MIQPEYQKWVSKLLGYDFEIQYRPGPKNKVADALSWLPEVAHLANLSVPCLVDIKVVKAEVMREKLLTVWNQQHEDPDYISKFSIHHDTLQYKGRLVLSWNSQLIPPILHFYHD